MYIVNNKNKRGLYGTWRVLNGRGILPIHAE